MADLNDALRQIVSENNTARERFARIASRTVSAIMRGDSDGLNDIIRQFASSEEAGESSVEPVETGDADGATGVQGVDESPG